MEILGSGKLTRTSWLIPRKVVGHGQGLTVGKPSVPERAMVDRDISVTKNNFIRAKSFQWDREDMSTPHSGYHYDGSPRRCTL